MTDTFQARIGDAAPGWTIRAGGSDYHVVDMRGETQDTRWYLVENDSSGERQSIPGYPDRSVTVVTCDPNEELTTLLWEELGAREIASKDKFGHVTCPKFRGSLTHLEEAHGIDASKVDPDILEDMHLEAHVTEGVRFMHHHRD